MDWFQPERDEPLAQVYEQKLYFREIKNQIPRNSEEDSIAFVQNYINNWVNQQLLLEKASFNIADNPAIDQQVNDYRNQLIIYEYERRLVQQRLDTIVSRNEIKQHYQDNQQEFVLTQPVVLARVIVLDSNVQELGKVKELIASNEEQDLDELQDFAIQFAKQVQLDEKWYYWEQLKSQLPIESTQAEALLTSNKLHQFSTSTNIYLVFTIDFQQAGTSSPLQLVSNRISKVILNKRKLGLLSKLKTDLYQQALNDNKIKLSN